MIYPYGNLKFPTPFSESKVDNIAENDGFIDSFEPISLEIKDERLIENLNQRIEDSKTYYNDSENFDLEQKRAENLRMYLGIQADSADFYEQEEPYIENQIRRAVDSIVAYATARTPQSVCTPADDTPQAKKFAGNLEKSHNLHSTEFDLRGTLETGVRSWLLTQECNVLLEFDPMYGDNGEIIPKFLPSDECVRDKNARPNENPEFFTHYEKHSMEELVFTFPEKKAEILKSQGYERMGKTNRSSMIVIKKTWFTYWGKDGKPLEAVAIHYDDVMLGKFRDLNWLHGQRNFLKAPRKPIISLSVLSDGKHAIDFSNPLDDGIRMQKLLNSRGKQISQNASRSNGTTVIDGKKSGLTKEDVENWTGGPNQKIYLKKAAANVPLENMIFQLPGQDVKEFVVNDKQDMRTQLNVLMSVPVDQTGADISGDDVTLGQSLLKKSNDDARQDMIVRGIDRFLYEYFNMLTQMMFVWYDEDHFFPYLDTDGSFEKIVIKRYYFDDGMRVNVKGQSTIAFDKNREQAMALHLLEHNQLSYLDGYRILGFENPQKLYDNWAKQQKDPFELVRDANDAYDDGDAYAEFLEFMNGSKPKFKEDASKDFILTLRKLMLSNKFMKAKKSYQLAFMDRLTQYLEEYELKSSLDQLSELDFNKLPMGGQPIPPPMPQQQFQQAIAPPAPPMAPPGMPPPGGMPPGMPGGQPPQPMPGQPPQGGGQPGVFNGTPLMNPGRPQTPSGLSAIPSI